MGIFKKNGLKNKTLRRVTVPIVCTMIIVVLLFYGVFRTRTLREQAVYEEESLNNVEAYLKAYFEEVDAIAKNVNYNYYLQNYLEEVAQKTYKYSEPSLGKNMRTYEMSSQAFSDTLLSRPDISSIMIFGREQMLLYKSLYSYRHVVIDYSDLDWYKQALENPMEAAITGPNRHAFFDSDDETISLSREVQNDDDGSFLGIVLINLNMNKIAEICESYHGGRQGYFCIINEKGELVYSHQNSGKEGYPQDEEGLESLNKSLVSASEKSFRLDKDGVRYLVSGNKMEEAGWTLVNVLPYSVILNDLMQTIGWTLGVVGLILILTLVLLNRILTDIVRPVQRLQANMECVGPENLYAPVVIETDDEIGSLSRKFNSMLERIEHLKEQVVEEQEDKRKYELQALQAQINPHFLYNTLDSIIWMAETHDSNIVAMTEALAKLFRISLNKGSEILPLKTEIEHVRNYLIIQSMRYAEKFTYDIQIEHEVEQCRIIKLIVQPIVENCIYHGIKKKRGSGHIRIRAFREDENLIILVEDDGCGMSQEICDKILRDDFEPENISGSGIGVRNVNERIKLAFGEEYGLFYTSEAGQGTIVRYVLPFQNREDLT